MAQPDPNLLSGGAVEVETPFACCIARLTCTAYCALWYRQESPRAHHKRAVIELLAQPLPILLLDDQTTTTDTTPRGAAGMEEM